MRMQHSIQRIYTYFSSLLWTPQKCGTIFLENFVTVTAKEKDGTRWDKYALFEREPRRYSAIWAAAIARFIS